MPTFILSPASTNAVSKKRGGEDKYLSGFGSILELEKSATNSVKYNISGVCKKAYSIENAIPAKQNLRFFGNWWSC